MKICVKIIKVTLKLDLFWDELYQKKIIKNIPKVFGRFEAY